MYGPFISSFEWIFQVICLLNESWTTMISSGTNSTLSCYLNLGFNLNQQERCDTYLKVCPPPPGYQPVLWAAVKYLLNTQHAFIVDHYDGHYFIERWNFQIFLAALAALYLTLVTDSLTDWLTATLEFWHQEWLLRLETHHTFDQSDVWTKWQKDKETKRQKDKKTKRQKDKNTKWQKDKKIIRKTR